MKDRFWLDEYESGIYSKKLDGSKPKLFYDGHKNIFSQPGRILKPFLNNRCLISVKWPDLQIIPVLNDFTPGEVKTIEEKNNYNIDSDVFKDNLFVLSLNGNLNLYKVRLKGGKLLIKELQNLEIRGIKTREEISHSLKISQKGEFLLVNHRDRFFKNSSLIIFQMNNLGLVLKTILDLGDVRFKVFNCLKFWGAKGNLVYFSGLSYCSRETDLVSYVYDKDLEEVREVKRLRRSVDLGYVEKFVDRGKKIAVGISKDSQILVVRYKDG